MTVSVVGQSLGVSPVFFSVSAGLVSQLALSGVSDTTTAGQPVQVTVNAKDANGNPVLNYGGTVHLTSTDPAASLPAAYTFTAGDNGTHTFAITLNSSGKFSVTVSDTATPPNSTTASTTVVPVVTANTAGLPDDVTSLTIAGSGFDPNPANDQVTFSGGITGTVIAATRTRLTVGNLSGVAAGPLTAVVTANRISSGTAATVATIAPAQVELGGGQQRPGRAVDGH